MRSKIDPITAGKSAEVYAELLENIAEDLPPHQFIGQAYSDYLDRYPNNPSVNGRIFEYLVCEVLVREEIVPFYFQAHFALVPNADFDVVALPHAQTGGIVHESISTRAL